MYQVEMLRRRQNGVDADIRSTRGEVPSMVEGTSVAKRRGGGTCCVVHEHGAALYSDSLLGSRPGGPRLTPWGP